MTAPRKPGRDFFLDNSRASAVDDEMGEAIDTQYVTSEGVHSFTTKAALRKWLAGHKAMQRLDDAQARRADQIRTAFEKLSPHERAGLQRRYTDLMTLHWDAMKLRAKIAGVSQPEELENTQHPLLKGFGNSAWLYRHCNWRSLCMYMPVNSFLASLHLFGCGDAVSSLSIHTGWGAAQSLALYTDSGFMGPRRVFVADVQTVYLRVACLKGYPHYFNDRASSAMLTIMF